MKKQKKFKDIRKTPGLLKQKKQHVSRVATPQTRPKSKRVRGPKI